MSIQAIFVSGPLFGKHMHSLGLKNVYIFGVVSTGVCALLFGFLDFVDNKVFFKYLYVYIFFKLHHHVMFPETRGRRHAWGMFLSPPLVCTDDAGQN